MIAAEDERHGTVNAYKNHGCRCDRCTATYSAYNKRRDYLFRTGRSLRVSSFGVHRRIRALQALGYGLPTLAAELGIATGNLSYKLQQPYVARTTHEAVAALFDRLCMKPPPAGWVAKRTRSIARKRGWASPLAWDDDTIDDPTAEPRGMGYLPRYLNDNRIANEYDPAVVERILGGDFRVPATSAERRAVVARWPGTHNELEAFTGWRVERYTERESA